MKIMVSTLQILKVIFILISLKSCHILAVDATSLNAEAEAEAEARYLVHGEYLRREAYIQKVSGEDSNGEQEPLILKKFRALLGLKSFKFRRAFNGGGGGTKCISPSPAPSPTIEPPALPPVVHFHRHSGHSHRHRVPPPMPHRAENKERGKGRVRRIIVAVSVSAGATTFLLCAIMVICVCKRFRKQKKKSISSVKKVRSDPGLDMFYLNSIGTALEPPQGFCIKQNAEAKTVETKENEIEIEHVRSGSAGEISSVHEIEVVSSDDESFHSFCESNSWKRRLSNASEAALSDRSEMLSPRGSNMSSRMRLSNASKATLSDKSDNLSPIGSKMSPFSVGSGSCNKQNVFTPTSPPHLPFPSSHLQIYPHSTPPSPKTESSTPKYSVNNSPSIGENNSNSLKSSPPPPPPPPPPPVPSSRSNIAPYSSLSLPKSPRSIRKSLSPPPLSDGYNNSIKSPPPPPPLPLPNSNLAVSSHSSILSPRVLESSPPVPPKPPMGIPPPPSMKGPPPPPSQFQQIVPLGKDGTPLPRLKPLHWDKVRGGQDHSMVWDKLRSSSFEFDEEMIESLFGYNLQNSMKNDEGKSKNPSPSKSVLEPKRLQNLTILSKALNVTPEQICDALLQGEGLCLQQLEALMKMTPTKEEEAKLLSYKGDIAELGSAERSVRAMLNIPFAFQRVEAMLYRETFEDEVVHLRKSFEMLEEACKELRSSRLFLKLLEAVLKTGNRMNVGTIRGGARAFKLDALLKLADVKGTDGKTTLLHFVVQEIVRSEGIRVSESIMGKINQRSRSGNADDREEDYKRMGLELVSGLSVELCNVKKTATIDLDVLASSVSNLSEGMSKLKHLCKDDDKGGNFVHKMRSFLNYAERNITELREDEGRVFLHVKEVTEYFHGHVSKDEPNLLRIFVIVRDFLGMLDHVCKELRSSRVPTSPNPLAPFR